MSGEFRLIKIFGTTLADKLMMGGNFFFFWGTLIYSELNYRKQLNSTVPLKTQNELPSMTYEELNSQV